MTDSNKGLVRVLGVQIRVAFFQSGVSSLHQGVKGRARKRVRVSTVPMF